MIIVFTDPITNTVSVMHPFHREEGWTDADFIAYHKSKCPPGTRDATVFPPELLPQHAEYQGAWIFQGGAITINMERAREIHRDLLREARLPFFSRLDGEMARALEEGADTSTLRQQKQYLRDITKSPRIAQAQTTAELRAIQIELDGEAPPMVIPNEPPMLASMMPQVPPPPSPFILQPEEVTMPELARAPWSLKDLMARAGKEDEPLPPLPSEPAAEHDEPVAHVAELVPMEAAQAPQEPAYIPPAPPAPAPLPSLPEPPPLEDYRTPPAIVLTDEERRRQAVERIAMAAMQIGGEQIRYEVAIQAHNGNVDALQMLQDEAAVYGMSSDALAHQIIMQRTLQEQRVMRAHAAKARALATIERMTGHHIDMAADDAVQQIKEEGHAGTS